MQLRGIHARKSATRNAILIEGLTHEGSEKLVQTASDIGVTPEGKAQVIFPWFGKIDQYLEKNPELVDTAQGYEVSLLAHHTFVFTLEDERTPEEYIKGLSKCYPNYTIHHECCSIAIPTGCYKKSYKNGEVVDNYPIEDYSKEAYELAFQLWGEFAQEIKDNFKYWEEEGTYIPIPEEEKLCIYRLSIDCGRHGYLDGIFTATPEQVCALIESEVYVHFGEDLGKHSDILYRSLEESEINLVSSDPKVVKVFVENDLATGHNPFNYLERTDVDIDQLVADRRKDKVANSETQKEIIIPKATEREIKAEPPFHC